MTVKRIAWAGLVAAVYIVLSMALGSVSFGVVNVRLAVGLTMAAFFGFEFMFGVFIAHVITNLLGGLGLVDVIIGPIAGLLCMWLAVTIDGIANKNKNTWVRWLIMTLCFIPASMAIGYYLSIMFGVPTSMMILMVMAGNAIAQAAVGIPILEILKRMTK